MDNPRGRDLERCTNDGRTRRQLEHAQSDPSSNRYRKIEAHLRLDARNDLNGVSMVKRGGQEMSLELGLENLKRAFP